MKKSVIIKLMNQKGFAPILVILLIVLTVGGYFLYQKQFKSVSQQSQSTSTTTSDSDNESFGSSKTANWKIYTNKGYGFSFKYPTQFTLKEQKYTENQQNLEARYTFWFYTQDQKYSGYNVRIHKAPGKTILQEFPEEFRQQKPSISVKVFSNTQGADEAASAGKTEDGYQSGIRYFRVKDTFFSISPIYQDSNSDDEIWNYPIIDTFKFS